jgi:hypothetical protein
VDGIRGERVGVVIVVGVVRVVGIVGVVWSRRSGKYDVVHIMRLWIGMSIIILDLGS